MQAEVDASIFRLSICIVVESEKKCAKCFTPFIAKTRKLLQKGDIMAF